MKIAFLILSLSESGGAERAVTALSSSIADKGHEVTLISLCGNSSFYETGKNVHMVFLNLPPLPGGKSTKRLAAVIGRAKRVRSEIRLTKPDFVIGFSHIMSAYAVFSAAFTSTVAIGTERSNPYALGSSAFMKLFRKSISLMCGGYVFQTVAAKEFFPKSAQRKSAVISNAVYNTDILCLEPVKIREKTVTALGRLTECKGFDTLIKAFALVNSRFPDYKLVIYGSGSEEQRLKSIAAKECAKDSVVFPGSFPDAAKKAAASSVFVLSSRYEGMPNALIEAMASGVPCVSTRCKMGPEELICDGENGLLVPVDDIAAMSDAICRILSDGELAAALGAKAVEIKTQLSPEVITNKWISYLESQILRKS